MWVIRSIAHFKSAIVCSDVTAKRIRELWTGTVGGRIAIAAIPASCNLLLNRKVFSFEPTTIGTI